MGTLTPLSIALRAKDLRPSPVIEFRGVQFFPSHPPLSDAKRQRQTFGPSLPKNRGAKGGDVGNLGVWVGKADPNTQISDKFLPLNVSGGVEKQIPTPRAGDKGIEEFWLLGIK
jgi:hypothetical protein